MIRNVSKLLSVFTIVYLVPSNIVAGEQYIKENFNIICKGIGKEKLVSEEKITNEWETEFNFLINVESFLVSSSSRELFNIRVGAAKKMYSGCYPSGNRAHIVCVKSEESDTSGVYHKIKISRVSGRYVEDLHTFEKASSNRSEYHMSKRGQCKKIEVEKDT